MIRIFSIFVATLAVVFVTGCQGSQPATFHSPGEAFDAYAAALDKSPDAAIRVLGPAGVPIVRSGDSVADRKGAALFVKNYRLQHTLNDNADGSVTAMIGPRGWPMPIPLVKNDKGLWQFDAAAGTQEILDRRIGRNELWTIQTMLAIADAEQDYVDARPLGGAAIYAGKFISSPDRKDGLYWPTTQPSDPQSPLGDLIGKAADEGYSTTRPVGMERPAYHGYHYRFLSGQGSHADGGAWEYAIQGRMMGGFAVLAYPATYGNSGIMSFIVNQSGTVYQKDLGAKTAEAAKAIKTFDPEPGWTKVEALPTSGPTQ